MRYASTTAATAVLVALLAAAQTGATQKTDAADMTQVTRAMVDTTIAAWKPEPKKAAGMILSKYGLPQEVTANRLIWHNNGPWKMTELVNEEVPHDFPMPHKDLLYQSISYRVDPDHADELLEFDGSVILERTKGEMAARCDKEEANFLAVNLAHEIANGQRSAEDARRFYAETIAMMMKGQSNEYLKGLKFDIARAGTGDRDKPFGPVATSGKKQ